MGSWELLPWQLSPVVVGFERPVFVESQVFGLIVRQLCEVSVERGQVQTGHVLVWEWREGKRAQGLRIPHPSTEGWKVCLGRFTITQSRAEPKAGLGVPLKAQGGHGKSQRREAAGCGIPPTPHNTQRK